MVILLFVTDIEAKPAMECLRDIDYFEDPYTIEYVERCTDILNDCIDQLIENSVASERDAYRKCNSKPLVLDSRYTGPCPKVLYELENVNDPIGTLSARALLRSDFQHVVGANYWSTYKFDETKRELIKALSNHPNDIGLLNNMIYYSTEDDVVLELETTLKLIELDPDCEFHLSNSIPHLVSQLVRQLLSKTPPSKTQDFEKTEDLIRRAWLSYLSIFDHAYETTSGLSKLSYGIQSYSDDFFSRDDLVKTAISDILGVSPTDFVANRKEYVLSDLLRVLGTESNFTREDKLEYSCNDYAFEIGLFQRCLELIDYYSKMDAKRQTGLPVDIYEATLNSLMTITRNCHSDLLLNIYLYESYITAPFCINEYKAQLISKLTTFIARYPRSSQTSQLALLEIYSSLSERTPQDFFEQLELDSRLILHSWILARRLYHMDLDLLAIEILNRSIEFVNGGNLDGVVLSSKDQGALGFSSQLFRGNEGNSNQILHVLVEAKMLYQRKIDYQILKESRSTIGW